MDKAFWQAVLENDCAVPEGHSIASLTAELLAELGSIDPVLRDDIALSILAAWIDREGAYTHDELRAIGQQMAQNLTLGIGEQDSDSVFLRSFSALVLDYVIDYDNAHPFLEPSRGAADTGSRAAISGARARSARLCGREKGWAHSAARTPPTCWRTWHATRRWMATTWSACSTQLLRKSARRPSMCTCTKKMSGWPTR